MLHRASPFSAADCDAPLVAGVELGGTKCVCIIGRGPGSVVDLRRFPTRGPTETLDAILSCLTEWCGRFDVKAIGVASFGPLWLDPTSHDHGSILATAKAGWSGTALLPVFERLGPPVTIDTDVSGAALAEGRWGAAQNLRSWAYVTVGTGVGAGVFVNRTPVAGLMHSEAGHMRVPRLNGDRWPGACPFHGDCVEGLASGPAIAARTGRSAEALADDDPAWDFVADALAAMIHNLLLTAGTERVLLGGGVGGRPHLLARVRDAVGRSLNGYVVREDMSSLILAPHLGAMAGPLGALAVAGQPYLSPPRRDG